MSVAVLGHAVAGQRVGRPVARTSLAAPWPGQGLRLKGSLGMLLLPSVIPCRWDVELDGTDFPMLRQMLFHAPLSKQLCRPKQVLRKKGPCGGLCLCSGGSTDPTSAKHPPAFAPLETKNHSRGCVTPVTHTWQHIIREEPLLSYPTACAQRTLHWIHGFLGSGVPERYTTGLHAKRVNCLLRDLPQVRYWLDLGIGSGISKNPWNTKQGLRKRSL